MPSLSQSICLFIYLSLSYIICLCMPLGPKCSFAKSTERCIAATSTTVRRHSKRRVPFSSINEKNTKPSGKCTPAIFRSPMERHARRHSYRAQPSQPTERSMEASKRRSAILPSLITQRHMIQRQIYECKWPNCPWRFIQFIDLERHCRVHTGQKPFPCMVLGCGEKFGRACKYRSQHAV